MKSIGKHGATMGLGWMFWGGLLSGFCSASDVVRIDVFMDRSEFIPFISRIGTEKNQAYEDSLYFLNIEEVLVDGEVLEPFRITVNTSVERPGKWEVEGDMIVTMLSVHGFTFVDPTDDRWRMKSYYFPEEWKMIEIQYFFTFPGEGEDESEREEYRLYLHRSTDP